MPWGGHPQGAPLPFVFSRRYALGRAPTRGAPTNCLLSALPIVFSALGRAPTRGAPTNCLLSASSLGVMPWGGHPQGAPLPIVFSRRFALGRAPTRGAPTRRNALGRAPTRGAPTRFRQPHVGLSQFDAIALLLARSKNSDATIFYQCQHERRRGQESAEPVNLFCKPAAISRPAKLGVLR